MRLISLLLVVAFADGAFGRPRLSEPLQAVNHGILSDLEVWSGSRRILQIKGKSSAAAPLPDACFAPVSREALHFLVAEAGESCPEVCQRAGYGTSDSGYGAFSGGDGAGESVLCRVELEGATHLFGWQNATGGPCEYVNASGSVTHARTPAYPASPADGPSCACLALPLEELSWEKGTACPEGHVPVTDHPRICRIAVSAGQESAAGFSLGWLKSDTCLSALPAAASGPSGDSSGTAAAVAAGGDAGLGMQLLCQPQLEMDPELLPADPRAPDCAPLQPEWPLLPGSSAVAWLEAEGRDCPAACQRHGFSQGDGDLGAVGVSGLSLCRHDKLDTLEQPAPGRATAEARMEHGLSRTERQWCEAPGTQQWDGPEPPASFQCACLRIPRERLFWSDAGSGCPLGAAQAVPEAPLCRVRAAELAVNESALSGGSLGLLQPDGCWLMGSSSAQGVQPSDDASVLCYSLEA